MTRSSLTRGKKFLKHYRWLFRRFFVIMKYGHRKLNESPIVFGNSMPKSGSHLLTQVLYGLVHIGPFINPGFPPVNRDERNQPLDEHQILENIRSMKSGDIRYGYIHAREPYLSLLTQQKYAVIFIYRDPRDMLISHIFYAKDMYSGHGMHDYYNLRLSSMEERINAAVIGVDEPGFELASVRKRYESYLGWLRNPQVLALKFEDLVTKCESTFENLLNYLEHRGAGFDCSWSDAVDILIYQIQPHKSGTYRKGVSGEWKRYFTEFNKEIFKQTTGNLLQELGYENSDDW